MVEFIQGNGLFVMSSIIILAIDVLLSMVFL